MLVRNNYLRTSCNGAKEVAVVVSENPTTAAERRAVTPINKDGGEDRLVAVDQLLYQLRGFIRLMKRGVAQLGPGLRRDGLEYAAFALLAQVIVDGPKRITVLAEVVHADPSTVSRQTAALVRHGLLERRPDPVDGRASILAATAEGERVFEENRKQSCAWMAEMLTGWSTDEVEQLAGLLARANGDVHAFYQNNGFDRAGSVIELRERKR
ncbi:MAG TPA: MarR family transcriptional regulator [Pseudonocardiaceae bacterium]|jgi:DNA-binding MarR family transcriptional regulator|nr:MarR family transcriptional regulator [Pseudonocardiaceae bacterium]